MKGEINCLARARYRQKKEGCKLSFQNGKYTVTFEKPQEGITPGQSLVIYFADDMVSGSGGEINKTRAKTLGGVII